MKVLLNSFHLNAHTLGFQVLLAHVYILIFYTPANPQQYQNLSYLQFPVVLVFPVGRKKKRQSKVNQQNFQVPCNIDLTKYCLYFVASFLIACCQLEKKAYIVTL